MFDFIPFEIVLLSLAAVLVTTLGVILWWHLAGDRVKALIAGWLALPLFWKIVLPVVFGAFVLHGSVKRGEGGKLEARTGSGVVVNPLHRYLAPTNYAADLSIFNRPTNAVTPKLWTKYCIVDDFQLVPGGRIAGVCGAVTTQPWGIDTPDRIKDIYETFAPLYSTNALIKGVSDFWAVTNEFSQTYVWKDLAHKSDRSNLISFAATLYDWGDIEFTYGNVPTEGFTSFVKLKDKTLDLTGYVAPNRTVKIEKNFEQDTEWWLENYPEICYTNAVGDLVFDYDTNEWYFVELIIGYEEAKSEYEADVAAYYENFYNLTNTGEVVTQVFSYKTRNNDYYKFDAEERKLHAEMMESVTAFVYDIFESGAKVNSCACSTNDLPTVNEHIIELPVISDGCYTNYFRTIFTRIDEKGRYSDIINKIGVLPSFYDSKYIYMSDEVRRNFYKRKDDCFDEKLNLPVRSIVYPTKNIELVIVTRRESRLCIKTTPCNSKNTHWTNTFPHRQSKLYTLPCRIGKIYEATASNSIIRFEQDNKEDLEDDDICEIWRVSDSGGRKYRFMLPVRLEIENAYFAETNYMPVRAKLSPAINFGSYKWEMSSNFEIIKDFGKTAVISRKNGDAGWIKCIWDNGDDSFWNLTCTGRVDVLSNPKYDEKPKFLSITPSSSCVVCSEEYLDKNGNLVNTSGTNVMLTCSYGGQQSGTMEFRFDYDLGGEVYENGVRRELPYRWDVSGGQVSTKTLEVRDLSPSGEYKFNLFFTSEKLPEGFMQQASVRVVKFDVEADRTWPEMRKRHVFGPNEPFTLKIDDAETKIIAPKIPGTYATNLTYSGHSIPFSYSVIAPQACIATNAWPMADSDWAKVGVTKPLSVGEVGAGMCLELKLLPEYVSFEGLKVMEGECSASKVRGYFSAFDMSNVRHNASNGALRQIVVQESNFVGIDRAGSARSSEELPGTWSYGSYEWQIPFYWSADDFVTTNRFATNIQEFELLSSNGDFVVRKFGWKARRSMDGNQTVTRDEQ